jgi:hypothetical protein
VSYALRHERDEGPGDRNQRNFIFRYISLFSNAFLTVLVPYLFTPRWRMLFQKLIVTQLVKQQPAFFNGNRRIITVLTKARHWTLSWASRIQSSPSISIALRPILILSSHLRLVFPVVSNLRVSQLRPCKHLSPPPCVPHVPPTSSPLI